MKVKSTLRVQRGGSANQGQHQGQHQGRHQGLPRSGKLSDICQLRGSKQFPTSKVPTTQPCNLRCWDSWGIIRWLMFRPAEQQLFWSGYKPRLTECRQQNILTLLPLYNVSRFAASFQFSSQYI